MPIDWLNKVMPQFNAGLGGKVALRGNTRAFTVVYRLARHGNGNAMLMLKKLAKPGRLSRKKAAAALRNAEAELKKLNINTQ